MNNDFNITQEELELIDKYLNKQLPESELAAFEKKLADDETWRDKVDQIRFMSIGIQESTLSAKLNNFHSLLNVEANGKTQKSIEINWGKRLAVAASTILVVGTLSWLLFFKKTVNEQLFANYYQADPGLPTLMGVSDNYEFDKAMVDYKMGDYDKALKTWEGLLKDNANNDTLNYFIASAHLADNNPESSLAFFDKVIGSTNSVFLQDAQWYKALILLNKGNKQEAINLLQKTEHPDKEALLRKLKE